MMLTKDTLTCQTQVIALIIMIISDKYINYLATHPTLNDIICDIHLYYISSVETMCP